MPDSTSTALALGPLASAEMGKPDALGSALGSPPPDGPLCFAPGSRALPLGPPGPDPYQRDDQNGDPPLVAQRTTPCGTGVPPFMNPLLRSGRENGACPLLTRTATPQAIPPADTPCGRHFVTHALGFLWDARLSAQAFVWKCMCFGRACPLEDRNADSPHPCPGSASHASVSSLLEQRGSQPELGRAASHRNTSPPREEARIAAPLSAFPTNV